MKRKLLTIPLLTLAIVCLAKNQPVHSQTSEGVLLKKAKQARLEKAVIDARKEFEAIKDSICYYSDKSDSLYQAELLLVDKKRLLEEKSRASAYKALQVMKLAELKSSKVPAIIIITAPKREIVLPKLVRPSIVPDSTRMNRRTFWDKLFFRHKD